jgi:hypothetical protein
LFIGGAAGFMIFNIIVLGLGDPKFPKGLETALGIYLPIWLVFYIPHMIVGWLMLTVKIPVSRRQTIAFIGYTFLILLAIEISFVLDAKLAVVALTWVAALFIAWLVRLRLLGVELSAKA